MVSPEFKDEIKQLIITSLKLDITADSIADDAPLFQSGLGLDSIDALELAVAIERKYHVTIPDEKVGKQAFSSVEALAGYVAAHREHQLR
jgi:acyl carrier protein